MSEPISLPTKRITHYSAIEETKLRGEETLEVIIPDRLPDAMTVLFTDGQAWKKNREDMLQITSEVTALIRAESGDLYTLSCEIPVTIRGNGNGGVGSEETATYQIVSEQYQTHIVNSRKVSFSVEIETKKTVCRENNLEYVTELGENSVEKQQTYECMPWCIAGNETFTVQDTLPYPEGKKAAADIYRKKAELLIQEKKILQDKVLLRAAANIEVHYLDENGNPEKLNLTIPFTRAVELKGLDDRDRVNITLIPGILTVVPEKENAQERISVSLAVTASSKGYRSESVAGPVDGYSLDKELIFEKSLLTVTQGVYERQEQLNCTITAEFPESPEEILDFWVSAAPVSFAHKGAEQEKAVSAISVVFLYRVGERVGMIRKDENVEWCGELDAGKKTAGLYVTQQHYTAPVSQKSEIEVEMLLNISGEIEKEIPLITSVESEPKKTAELSSLLITRTVGEMTLFELGKRYNAVPEEIAEVNRIEGEYVVPGCRLVIPVAR